MENTFFIFQLDLQTLACLRAASHFYRCGPAQSGAPTHRRDVGPTKKRCEDSVIGACWHLHEAKRIQGWQICVTHHNHHTTVYQILPHYTSGVYLFTLSCFFCIDHPTQERLGSSAVTSQEHPKATKPHGSAKLQTRTDWRVQYLFNTYVFEVNTPTWNWRQTRQLCNRHQTSPSKNFKYQWATVAIASGRYLWLAISRRKLMED